MTHWLSWLPEAVVLVSAKMDRATFARWFDRPTSVADGRALGARGCRPGRTRRGTFSKVISTSGIFSMFSINLKLSDLEGLLKVERRIHPDALQAPDGEVGRWRANVKRRDAHSLARIKDTTVSHISNSPLPANGLSGRPAERELHQDREPTNQPCQLSCYF
jgi:hypothetical protein